MPATPRRSSRLAEDPPGLHQPLLPTVVVGSYKGGTGKTSLSVAIAERLAWAGLRVLLLTCDSQEDARHRLGVQPHEPQIARRSYGDNGTVTVVGIRGAQAVEVLYRSGPGSLGAGMFDMAVVDTPPEVIGGSLPGVLLIATLDGTDAARNLITMLRRTPANTEIVLVRLGRQDPAEWVQNAGEIEKAAGRALGYVEAPLPRTRRIKAAHDEGRSVWTVRRSGRTLEFLDGVEELAHIAWHRLFSGRQWPTMPRLSSNAAYVPGWDDDE
jgi:hypothetical protein